MTASPVVSAGSRSNATSTVPARSASAASAAVTGCSTSAASGRRSAQIRAHFADLNGNGVYDVYDYSFTMAALDGGTKQKGKAAGTLAVIPSKMEVEAGDEITVDVYATDADQV